MRRGLVLVLGVAAILGGCNRATVDTLDDSALQAINDAAVNGLNEPGAAISQLLKSLDKPTPISLDAMQISLDQKETPVDWWLIKHGFVTTIDPPPTPGRPTFLVTTAGRRLSGGPPVWFNVVPGEISQVDCHTPEALAAGGCEVDLTVIPSLNEAGNVMAGRTELTPVLVHATVGMVGDQWQVRELRLNGPTLHDIAINTLLGKDAARSVARQQLLAGLGVKGAISAFEQATPAPPAGVDNAPAPFEPMPVAPVIGDNPYAARRGPAVP